MCLLDLRIPTQQRMRPGCCFREACHKHRAMVYNPRDYQLRRLAVTPLQLLGALLYLGNICRSLSSDPGCPFWRGILERHTGRTICTVAAFVAHVLVRHGVFGAGFHESRATLLMTESYCSCAIYTAIAHGQLRPRLCSESVDFDDCVLCVARQRCIYAAPPRTCVT